MYMSTDKKVNAEYVSFWFHFLPLIYLPSLVWVIGMSLMKLN